MPETITRSTQADSEAEPHRPYPQTFQGVLETYSGMHPYLQQHVERWATGEVLVGELPHAVMNTMLSYENSNTAAPEHYAPMTDTLTTSNDFKSPPEMAFRDDSTAQKTEVLPAINRQNGHYENGQTPSQKPESDRAFSIEHAVREIENHLLSIDTLPRSELSSKFQPSSDIIKALQRGSYNHKQLAGLVRTMRTYNDRLNEQFAKEYPEQPIRSDYSGILAALREAPSEALRMVYSSPEHSHDLKAMIGSAESTNQVFQAAGLFKKIYNSANFFDALVGHDALGKNDPLFRAFFDKSEAGGALLRHAKEGALSWPESTGPQDVSDAKRVWEKHFLEYVVQLPEALRNDLRFAAHSRLNDQKTGLIDDKKLYRMLDRVNRSANILGVAAVTQLYEEAGIINLDYYSTRQLRHTADVIAGNEKTIEFLKSRDITIIFSDGRGDFNGSLCSTNQEFDSTATLVFEINQSGDFDRYRALLKKRGIKAPTIVLAMHGTPGRAMVGQEGNGGFSITNDNQLQINRGRWSHHRLRNRRQAQNSQVHVANILSGAFFEDIMQDSRGIDDNSEAIGRRRVILKSCSLAKLVERNITRQLPRENPLQIWQRRRNADEVQTSESLAATLTKVIANPRVDVYGSDRSSLIELAPNGIRYLEVVKTPDGNKVIPMNITHMTVDEYGNVIERQVPEILLHKRAA